MPDFNDDESLEEFQPPSKSALKRQMTALQELGETLVALSDRELQKIPIEDEFINDLRRRRDAFENEANALHSRVQDKESEISRLQSRLLHMESQNQQLRRENESL